MVINFGILIICKCEYKLAEEWEEMIDNKAWLVKNKTISMKNKTNVST